MGNFNQVSKGQEKVSEKSNISYYNGLQHSLKQINKLCTQICEASASIINVLEEDTQYTISQYGEWSLTQLPKNKSICPFTFVEGKLLIIKDVKADLRTKHIEFPEGHKIRFYAGIPIRNKEGEMIASLCVVSYSPKGLSK